MTNDNKHLEHGEAKENHDAKSDHILLDTESSEPNASPDGLSNDSSPINSLTLSDSVLLELSPIVESLIFASDKAMTLDKIQQCLEPEYTVSKSQIKQVLSTISDSYQGRGIELVSPGGQYRFQTRSKYGDWVQRLWEEKPQKYSRALLETLALIAYRQPITRGDIEEVRGVAVSSHIMKTLMERGWVRVIGHREVPGRPSIYATTKDFLAHFNLDSLEDLPTLAEIRDIELIAKEVNAQLELDELSPPQEENTNEAISEDVAAQAEVPKTSDPEIESPSSASQGEQLPLA